jgi:uncharacterized membrane protein
MKGSIICTIIILILVLFISGPSQAELNVEPDEMKVDLVQGERVQRKITIINNGNTTITGHLWIINVECGYKCPSAHLSIKERELIELEPQESISATVKISSNLLNEPQDITLPIEFYTNDSENHTFLARIHITVHPNYGVYVGIPLIIIISIIFFIFVIKKKKQQINNQE